MTTLQISTYELSDNYEVIARIDDDIFVFICETYEQAINTHDTLGLFSDRLVDVMRTKYENKEV